MDRGKGFSVALAYFVASTVLTDTACSFSPIARPKTFISHHPAVPTTLSLSSSITATTNGDSDNSMMNNPLSSPSAKEEGGGGGGGEEENAKVDIQKRRDDLKKRLLEAADKFKAIQAVEQQAKQRIDEMTATESDHKPETGRFVVRLVRRIVSKILRRRRKTRGNKKKERTVLRSNAFATAKLEVGESGNAVIALAEELAQLNPTLLPTHGWKEQQQERSTSGSKLDGKWKLRFTTAADATFPSTPERGTVSTSQEIDAAKGTLTNVVDFEKGKIQGFRVVVAGDATSGNEIALTFRRVIILLRNARIFQKLVIPIPARLLRAVNRCLSMKQQKSSSSDTRTTKGPYFQIQYLDDDLRIHKTGEGNWFIQSRLE